MMKTLITWSVLAAFAVSASGSPAFASNEIVKALAPLTGAAYGMDIQRTKVRGKNAREMLEDYASRVKGYEDPYTVSLRLAAKDFPEADDGSSVVGLARIIDVTEFIVDPSARGLSRAEHAARTAFVRDLLFEVRDLGGRIGVESHSWSTCGVTFPGVFILDVDAKEVISISPADTTC